MDAQDPLVVETSVLLNYLHVGRLDLLAGSWAEIGIVEQVRTEVQRPDQIQALDDAIDDGTIQVYRIEEPLLILEALDLIQKEGYGPGECYSFVYAKDNNFPLAIDDRRASNAFQTKAKNMSLLTSQAIMVQAIGNGLITVPEADAIKHHWEKHCSYRLRIASFSELLS